jgi:hypothetical protein
MYKNNKNYKKQGIKLIGNNNCYLGIYGNFTNIINNCRHSLYFSNFLSKFVLYRVYDTDVLIYGRLMYNFIIKERNIQYKNDTSVSLPGSFVNISGDLYSIKRKTIKIIAKQNSKKNKIYNHFYYDFLKKNNSRCFFIFETKLNITRNILSKLYEYIIYKYQIGRAHV